MEKGVLLLLGFDRIRWERRKSEVREQWEKERQYPIRTVTAEKEIEIKNAAYWANLAVVDPLRAKYMAEAEAARERWPWDEKLLIQQMKGDDE